MEERTFIDRSFYKTANTYNSFIAEIVKGSGKYKSKIGFTIVKLTKENKAEMTLKFFLDLNEAGLLFSDILGHLFSTEVSIYKKTLKGERKLKISLEENNYRVDIWNKEAEKEVNGNSMFFRLSHWEARKLSYIGKMLVEREVNEQFK